MALRDWIEAFPIPNVATAATTAIRIPATADQSQVSQRSRCWETVGALQPSIALSQLSQQSQPLEVVESDSGESVDAREAFEERAAIMEYDGGLSGTDAEREAAAALSPTPHRWPFEEWDDTRPCRLCRNLTPGGYCLSAWKGQLRAARDYMPVMPDLPHRCCGYLPKADDPDRRNGQERWPQWIKDDFRDSWKG